jgi:hypothetical protein
MIKPPPAALPTLLAALALASCSAASPKPSGRWVGPVTPTTTGKTCVATRGMMQITAPSVIFAPDDGTWILNGSIEPDGAILADRTQIGANKEPYETSLTAHWTPEAVTGEYTTPRCKYAVRLTRK